jgi:hypothetical protein
MLNYMIKEIGSFFPINFNINIFNIYNNFKKSKDCFFFISGRIGIKFIIKNSKFKKYLLPNYMCESILNNFSEVEYDLYNIDNSFNIDYHSLKDKIIKNNYDAIYIIDYFGNIDDNIKNIIDICNIYNIIIIQDYTHNLIDNLYGSICISSYRKYLPSPFGCILYDHTKKLPKQTFYISFTVFLINIIKLFGMILKYIGLFKKVWYSLLSYCENKIDDIDSYYFDYMNYMFYLLYKNNNNIIRIKNYEYLKNNCIYTPISNIKSHFIYPIMFLEETNRNQIKNNLIKNKIFPIIYWPLNFDRDNIFNHYISDRILCIPIDERYTIDDMKYICSILNNI